MSSKKKTITLGLLGVVIAFTLLMYFGVNTNEKDSVSICAFVFTLLTELILFGNIFFLAEKKNNKAFLVAGFGSVTFIYVIVSFFVNVLLAGIFSLRGLIITNVSLLLLYVFIILLELLSKKEDE